MAEYEKKVRQILKDHGCYFVRHGKGDIVQARRSAYRPVMRSLGVFPINYTIRISNSLPMALAILFKNSSVGL
jgi:hypothetical protein